MTQVDEDIWLLGLIRDDDEKAFRRLFYKYMESLCQFIHLFIHERTAAEDLALDLFTTVWENRQDLDIKQSFRSYIFQAAKNKALTYLRDKKETIAIEEANFLSDKQEDTALHAEMRELLHLIEEAVMMLPEKCRLIYQKSREEELSNREIALHLQISEKTVENQITIALRKIKHYLKRNYRQ